MVLDESVQRDESRNYSCSRKNSVRSELPAARKPNGDGRDNTSSVGDGEEEQEQGRTEILGYESIAGLENKLDESSLCLPPAFSHNPP